MADSSTSQSDPRSIEATRLHDEAKQHYDRGEYPAARALFERALALRRAALGDDDLTTMHTLGELALVLAQQGDPAEAQRMIEHVLAVRERVLGPDHPDTTEAINNLGAVRRMQGDNDGARRLYERALAIREHVLGLDDPLTASTLSNLGVLLAAQGDYATARRYHERALDIYERTLGEDDPKTGRALNNLAAVLAQQGDRDSALTLLARALAVHEQALGPRHPSVANVLSNMADLYKMQRDYAAARPLYQRALIIRERALGAAHPRTAESVRSLMGVLALMREFTWGIPLNRISQALQRSGGHPDAATVEQLHAIVEKLEAEANRPPLSPASQQSLAEAAELQRQADALFAAQDNPGAQAALERALALREEVLGPYHMEHVPLLQKLGAALQAQGEYERLRPLQERIVETHIHTLGEDHPMTLRARTQLMAMHADEEGVFAAMPEMQQIQAALQQQVRPDDPLGQTIQHVGSLMEHFKTVWEQQQGVEGQPAGAPGAQAQPPVATPLSEEQVAEVLAGLDDVPWRTLQHAYGSATDVPRQLRALLSADEHGRERALHRLYETIWHQGTVYEATAYAVPFLLKLLAYPGTPDRASILQMLATLAEDDGSGGQGDDRWAKATHEAVGVGFPVYLDLLNPENDSEVRAAAIAVLAAFPERSAQSVPPLQAALAAEQVRLMRARVLQTLGQVMDTRAASQAFFEGELTRTNDAYLAFIAAGALADRAGEATPERAVEVLVAAAGMETPEQSIEGRIAAAAGRESGIVPNLAEVVAALQSMEPLESPEWVGAAVLAVWHLLKLGAARAAPALLRAFRRTRTGDTARAVAEALLDLTFHEGRIQSKSTAMSRQLDGRRKIEYRESARQPQRAASSLTVEQRVVLEALAAHEPFWAQDHDLLALYGLPASHEDLRAFLAKK